MKRPQTHQNMMGEYFRQRSEDVASVASRMKFVCWNESDPEILGAIIALDSVSASLLAIAIGKAREVAEREERETRPLFAAAKPAEPGPTGVFLAYDLFKSEEATWLEAADVVAAGEMIGPKRAHLTIRAVKRDELDRIKSSYPRFRPEEPATKVREEAPAEPSAQAKAEAEAAEVVAAAEDAVAGRIPWGGRDQPGPGVEGWPGPFDSFGNPSRWGADVGLPVPNDGTAYVHRTGKKPPIPVEFQGRLWVMTSQSFVSGANQAGWTIDQTFRALTTPEIWARKLADSTQCRDDRYAGQVIEHDGKRWVIGEGSDRITVSFPEGTERPREPGQETTAVSPEAQDAPDDATRAEAKAEPEAPAGVIEASPSEPAKPARKSPERTFRATYFTSPGADGVDLGEVSAYSQSAAIALLPELFRGQQVNVGGGTVPIDPARVKLTPAPKEKKAKPRRAKEEREAFDVMGIEEGEELMTWVGRIYEAGSAEMASHQADEVLYGGKGAGEFRVRKANEANDEEAKACGKRRVETRDRQGVILATDWALFEQFDHEADDEELPDGEPGEVLHFYDVDIEDSHGAGDFWPFDKIHAASLPQATAKARELVDESPEIEGSAIRVTPSPELVEGKKVPMGECARCGKRWARSPKTSPDCPECGPQPPPEPTGKATPEEVAEAFARVGQDMGPAFERKAQAEAALAASTSPYQRSGYLSPGEHRREDLGIERTDEPPVSIAYTDWAKERRGGKVPTFAPVTIRGRTYAATGSIWLHGRQIQQQLTPAVPEAEWKGPDRSAEKVNHVEGYFGFKVRHKKKVYFLGHKSDEITVIMWEEAEAKKAWEADQEHAKEEHERREAWAERSREVREELAVGTDHVRDAAEMVDRVGDVTDQPPAAEPTGGARPVFVVYDWSSAGEVPQYWMFADDAEEAGEILEAKRPGWRQGGNKSGWTRLARLGDASCYPDTPPVDALADVQRTAVEIRRPEDWPTIGYLARSIDGEPLFKVEGRDEEEARERMAEVFARWPLGEVPPEVANLERLTAESVRWLPVSTEWLEVKPRPSLKKAATPLFDGPGAEPIAAPFVGGTWTTADKVMAVAEAARG